MDRQTADAATVVRSLKFASLEDRRIRAGGVKRIAEERALSGERQTVLVKPYQRAFEFKQGLVQRRLLRFQRVGQKSVDLFLAVLKLRRLLSGGGIFKVETNLRCNHGRLRRGRNVRS